MAVLRARSGGSRYAAAAESCREARNNRLRRAGWKPGEPYPAADAQESQPEQPEPEPGSDFSSEFSSEFF